MQTQSSSFQTSLAANTLRACRHPGCNAQRVGLGALCKTHQAQADRYGDSRAYPLKPSMWDQERKQVSQLFQQQPDHPGLLQALSYLKTWTARACESSWAFKGASEIARLKRAGVPELSMLVELCAFYVWSFTAGAPRLPSDRATDFAMSRAVFGLAPRERRPTRGPGISGTWGRSTKTPASYAPKALPSALAYVGKHLRQVLSTFLATVRVALEDRRALEKDPDALFRLPFQV